MVNECHFSNIKGNLKQTKKPTSSIPQLGRQLLYAIFINNNHTVSMNEKIGKHKKFQNITTKVGDPEMALMGHGIFF